MRGRSASGLGTVSATGGHRHLRTAADARGWDHTYTRDQWLEQVPTFGGHSQVPPAKLRELLAGIGAAIDARGGSFTAHYTTVAATATRTAPPDP